MSFRPLFAIMLALAILAAPARSDVFTTLASYEPNETDLVVTAAGGDAGLTVAIVAGGQDGAPSATAGSHLLRATIAGETDRKVEIRHHWSNSTYDLAGYEQLLVDVYIDDAGALPDLIGIWSSNWSPPDAWQPADDVPLQTGTWTTIGFDVAGRTQVNLDHIWAFILEDLASDSGVAYMDNLRLRGTGPSGPPSGVAANGRPAENTLYWAPSSDTGVDGYHVYRSADPNGVFTQLTPAPLAETSIVDPMEPGRPRQYYYVTTVVNGHESAPSDIVSARYNGLPDEQMLNLVQWATLRYFWDYGHPHCGMAREGYNLGHSTDTVTTGGTGMGLMTIVVGAERDFVTRAAAADRVLRIVRFLDGVDPDDPNQPSGVQRYHGVWAHHIHGQTGATIPFAGAADNGGDLVETSFLVQGLLTARQYFDDPADPVESEIRNRITSMWAGVDWRWYRQFPGSDVLYWHWSPDYGWELNHQVRGFNEAMMVYLLACAAPDPNHRMPPQSFYFGWAGGSYANGNTYYGYPQAVGPAYGGPLFFTHYSYLGFDPRYRRDAYANYFEDARNISLINRAHCIANPNEHVGYNPLAWGLTASFDPWGYTAHSPTVDNGTLTPTAAISAMPFTPDESLATLRYFYDNYYLDLWGPYGFYDAFHPGEDWFAPGYVAIDQGTIVPMIENYRTGLCWRLFMSNPEIPPMLASIGLFYEVDFEPDGDVDATDLATLAGCLGGPGATPVGPCDAGHFELTNLDNDGDADLHDIAIIQMLVNHP